MLGASKILLREKGPGRTESATEVIGREEPLPTTIEEGLDETKGRRVEILLTDGVVWCVTSETATQSWTEVGGGWSTMELKELASNCWSQLVLRQGFHHGPGRLPGIAAATAMARTGGQETCRGLVWPRRPADAAVQQARGRGT
jgi:hypothetical protein